MRLNFILLLFIPIYIFGQDISAWEADIKKELVNVNWLQQANDGTLIVGGSKGLIGLNNKTGDILWKNLELTAVPAASVTHVAALPFILLQTGGNKANVVMMETHSGKVVTNSTNADFTVMNYNLFTDDGFILFELKENGQYTLSLYDIGKNETTWKLPIDTAKKGLKGVLKGQTSFLSKEPTLAGDVFVVNYKKKVMAVNLSSGDIVWSKEFDKKISELFVIGDEVFVSQGKEVVVLALSNGDQASRIKLKDDLSGYQNFQDGFYLFNDKGFNPFNEANKTVKWSDPDKIKQTHELYLTKEGYVSINLGQEDRVGDEGSVALVDENGKKKWQKGFDGTPIYVFPTAKGVFFISSDHSNVFGYKDGKTLIKKGVKMTDEYAVAFDDKNQEVVIYSDKKIQKFNVNSGELSLVTEDLKFKKFDMEKDFLSLEIRPNGYLLYSSNHTAFVNNSGKVDYKNYYPPVKSSWLVGAALDMVSRRSGMDLESSYGDFQQVQNLMKGVVVSGAKTTSGQRSKSSIVTATAGEQEVFDISVTRFYATSDIKDFLFVFTKQEDKKQLFKINKDTGEVAKKFTFKEKEPTYLVDEFDQRLYYLERSSIYSLPLN